MNCHALTRSALTAHEARQWTEASSLYQAALRCDPRHAPALHLYGLLQHQLGDSLGAATSIQQALVLEPNLAAAHNDLGIVLRALGRLPDAVASYQRALALAPAFADAHFNLGNAFKELGQPEEAVNCYIRADALKPGLPDVPTNCGAALRELNRLDEAGQCYAEALRRQADYPEARWNRGVIRLLRGEFTSGWEDYEWRWRVPGLLPAIPKLPQPEWDGGELRGRTILLHAEQGFGDTLQFIRYAPLLAARGATVLVQCQPALVTLLATVPGVSGVFADGATLPQFDTHAPLLSLPRLCGTTLENIPHAVPYLAGPRGRVALPPPAPGKTRRIGFAWAGNPANGADRQRSMTLADWLPLFAPAPATFYSLQCGPRAAELQTLPSGLPVHDLSSQLTDFAPTASAIQELDLVITVDTSVAHLAGALGRPVWTLLSFAACWRWLLHRTDSPWYPRMRLFRQPEPGNWRSVVEEVRRALG